MLTGDGGCAENRKHTIWEFTCQGIYWDKLGAKE